MHPEDRVHGIIRNGGQAPNIIPEHTSMEYYIRSPTFEGLESLVSRVETCFEAAALSTGCQFKLKKDAILKNVKSHPILADFYQQEMSQLGICISNSQKDGIPRGSTDMGNVSWVVPSLHPLFCISSKPLSFTYHTVEFEKLAGQLESQESALITAKALAMTGLLCMEYFNKNKQL